ncbi:MAG TPA: hypothetical protein EYO18_07830, partial [Candidatus Marinimicrobia bacterium]|nr:hypothetical protein [Candidatus Neomarinimicrobiota bacterium]
WNTSSGEGGGIYCNNADPSLLFLPSPDSRDNHASL